jgi:hypothetical protein
MSRRKPKQNSNAVFEQTSRQIESLKKSPLEGLALIFERHLYLLRSAVNRGETPAAELISFAHIINNILSNMPKSFEARFDFDSKMIEAIGSEWNHQNQRLSITIIPKHNSERWEHFKTTFPVKNRALKENRDNTLAITVIRFPEEDSLESVDLLDYPFLYHEMAHNMFYFDDRYFVDIFSRTLNETLGNLRLRAVADHGAAKEKSLKLINRVEEAWKPTPSHHNWAHEMAMDVVALWTCGPSYLAAFQDKLEDSKKDWFYIDQSHPPYAIRVEALINVAHQLGWQKYTEEIDKMLAKQLYEWKRTRRQNTNIYAALTSSELVDGCISAIIETCKNYNLPLLTNVDIEGIKNKFAKGQDFEFGTELVVAAWLYHQQNGNDKYEKWEREIVKTLAGNITQ